MFERRKHALPQKRIDCLIGAGNHGLELQAKARIVGDGQYRTLEMHVGAVVQGRLHHVEPGTTNVVELKRAAAE